MRYLPFLLLCSTPAFSQDIETASCFGTDPDWSLEIREDGASLDYLRASELSLALSTVASGDMEWPQAYTFIGRGDSAIVIREATHGDNSSMVRVLTQRGETPLLLIGKCYPN